MFKPEGTRFFMLRLLSGAVLLSERSLACLDCGLVWDYVRPGELKDFISQNSGEPGEEDGYALPSEGARLESQGDVAGALAKYETVMKKFPGTGAAKDAEFSIRNLNEKRG